MSSRPPIMERERWRVLAALVGMLAAMGFLAWRLWGFQVDQGRVYEENQYRQSVRRVRLPGIRGRIFDRHGTCLADNEPNYGLAIYLEELHQPGPQSRTVARIENLVSDLSRKLGVPPALTADDIRNHLKKRTPLPLVAWRNLDATALARWAELVAQEPGVDIYWDTVRIYPQSNTAAHLLGYVGRTSFDPGADDETFHYYLPEMEGKAGLEKKLDPLLRGAHGGRLVRVDVAGFRRQDMGERAPQMGQDVALALDVRIQRLAEQVLAGWRGAVVVMDPSTGDVLAMASAPGYDPNRFVPAISLPQWRELLQDPGKPLMNRAAAGLYAPGSIFKPVVAMAALEGHYATPHTQHHCPGFFSLGNATFRCWYHPGHGLLDMRQSLQNSCNVYYFKLALGMGYEPVYHMAAALGLGQKTGAEVDYEAAGLLPDNYWKQQVLHDSWRDGDTCNAAIGQGPVMVTPLQMAVVAAALANGGHVLRPRVVLGARRPGAERYTPNPPQVVNEMNWSAAALQTVRGGMQDVVMAPAGTGNKARVPGVTMAGKTGTAEYGRKEEGRKFGWMIAFAPFVRPRYAVAMVFEDALSGGATAAPLMRELMTGLFALGQPAGEGHG